MEHANILIVHLHIAVVTHKGIIPAASRSSQLTQSKCWKFPQHTHEKALSVREILVLQLLHLVFLVICPYLVVSENESGGGRLPFLNFI